MVNLNKGRKEVNMNKFMPGDYITVKENIEGFVAGQKYKVSMNGRVYTDGRGYLADDKDMNFIKWSEPETTPKIPKKDKAFDYLKNMAENGHNMICVSSMLYDVYGFIVDVKTTRTVRPCTKDELQNHKEMNKC